MSKPIAKRRITKTFCMFFTPVLIATSGVGPALAAGDNSAPPGRSIAYAIYDIQWSVYQTKDGKEECPNGQIQLGPREQFKAQFPSDGTVRKIIDTQLVREIDVWFPSDKPDQFEYREAGGKTAIGLDLDGKVKPTDFTSPEGKPGIDNQLFRVIGCMNNYRAEGSVLNFDKTFYKSMQFDRILVELTDVDSLINDDDVTITTYRGLDRLLNDATGNNYVPGGTQRLDLRFGKDFIHEGKGKIVNGVFVTTKALDVTMPHEAAFGDAGYAWMRDARFELKLTPDRAEGLIGGYADIETWSYGRNRTWSTHHLSYGQQSSGSVYRVLRKLADGFPDPHTGANTAISSAYSVKMVQVRVIRSEKELAQKNINEMKRFAANASLGAITK